MIFSNITTEHNYYLLEMDVTVWFLDDRSTIRSTVAQTERQRRLEQTKEGRIEAKGVRFRL
ncbi:hypothetical protein [Photorhabdus noenieputensis]|uniref:hypothetical protein n=1 Tax=Photorhabdus noenieputensis TaxID=1208607 RepID=UPI001BD3B3A6|nr:hypothetical protein [Photorhabdus noenieputensis]MCK3667834.1 hypothetical protein [Photorhabdus noenieputensis]